MKECNGRTDVRQVMVKLLLSRAVEILANLLNLKVMRTASIFALGLESLEVAVTVTAAPPTESPVSGVQDSLPGQDAADGNAGRWDVHAQPPSAFQMIADGSHRCDLLLLEFTRAIDAGTLTHDDVVTGARSVERLDTKPQHSSHVKR